MTLIYLFLFVLGAVVGSFLGMLTYRLPRGLALTGRSRCDKCGSQIRWRDNIPVFGYFKLKGRCARCRRPFSFRYPLVEFATALGFLAAGFLAKSSWELVFLLVFTTLSLALLVVDLEFKILPDVLTCTLGIFVLIFLFSLPSPLMFTRIIVGFLVFLFFLAIFLVTRGRGMGFGDVKISFVLGSLLGGYPEVLTWLFISFCSGALVGVVLLVLGKARLKTELAFGPYLLVGAWVTYVWGEVILGWYTFYT